MINLNPFSKFKFIEIDKGNLEVSAHFYSHHVSSYLFSFLEVEELIKAIFYKILTFKFKKCGYSLISLHKIQKIS